MSNVGDSSTLNHNGLGNHLGRSICEQDNSLVHDSSILGWDPMSEDYTSPAFNSYKEPTPIELATAIPGSTGSSPLAAPLKNTQTESQEDIQLYVRNIPSQMTQTGLKNLFSQAGELVSCKIVHQMSSSGTRFGFVGYKTVKEAECGIQKFDGFDLGNGVRLRVHLSHNKPAKAKLAENPLINGEANGLSSIGATENVKLQWSDRVELHDQNKGDATPSAAHGDGKGSAQHTAETPPAGPVQASLLCSVCNKPGSKWCSLCKTPYCSQQCQRQDWPQHKKTCHKRGMPGQNPKNQEERDRTNTEGAKNEPASVPAGAEQSGEDLLDFSDDDIQMDDPEAVAKLFGLNLEGIKSAPSVELESIQEVSQERDSFHITHTELPPEGPTLAEVSAEVPHQEGPSESVKHSYQMPHQEGPSNSMEHPYQVPHQEGPSETVKYSYQMPHQEGPSNSMEHPYQVPHQEGPSETVKYSYQVPHQEGPSNSMEHPYQVPHQEGPSETVKYSYQVPHQEGPTESVKHPHQMPHQGGPCTRVEEPCPVLYQGGPESVEHLTPQSEQPVPSCNTGHGRFFAKNLPYMSLPQSSSFDVVVTEVCSLSLLWCLLCEPEHTEQQQLLQQGLQSAYTGSAFKAYVPSPGELCVAQFTLDNCWYRAAVDHVANDGMLHVTYIDFGNGEDVGVDRIRPIEVQFTHFPRQARRIALYGVTGTEKFGGCSDAGLEFLRGRVQGIRYRAAVQRQSEETLTVDLLDLEGQPLSTILVSAGVAQFVTAEQKQTPDSQVVQPAQCDTKQSIKPADYQRPPTLLPDPASHDLRLPEEGKGVADSASPFANPPHDTRPSDTASQTPRVADFTVNRVAAANCTSGGLTGHDPGASSLLQPLQTSLEALSSSQVTGYQQAVVTSGSSRGEGSAANAVSLSSPPPFGVPSAGAESQRPTAHQEEPPFRVGVLPADAHPENIALPSPGVSHSHQHSYPPAPGRTEFPSSCAAGLPSHPQPVTSQWPLSQPNGRPPVSTDPRLGQQLHVDALPGTNLKTDVEFANSEAQQAAHGYPSSDRSPGGSLQVIGQPPTQGLSPYQQGVVTSGSSLGDSSSANRVSHGTLPPFGVHAESQRASSAHHIQPPSQVGVLPAYAPQPVNITPSFPGVSHSHQHIYPPAHGHTEFPSKSPQVIGRPPTQEPSPSTYRTEINSPPRNAQLPQEKNHHFNSSPQRPVRPVHSSPPEGESIRPSRHYPGSSPRGNLGVEGGRDRLNRASFPGMTGDASAFAPFKGIVNSVVSPWEFYVQKTAAESVQQLNSLGAALNEYIRRNLPKESFALNRPQAICAAQFSKDNVWYRAEIVQILQEGIHVRFIDFGNSEVVPLCRVRNIPAQFRGPPRSSVACSLSGVRKPASVWGPEAIACMRSLVAQKEFLCKPVSKRGGVFLVELLDEAGCAVVADEMLKRGFGARYVLNKLDELVFIPAIESAVLPAAREPFDIILTEVVTPGLMYAHLPRVAPALAELSQAMNSHYRSANYPRTDVQEGQLYAALFAETNDWCRAVVKSFAPHDRVSVLYVDFGNMEMLTASQLRPLEERFRSLPFSALRCSLAYLKLGVRWSEEAIAFVKSTLLPFGSFTAKIARKKRELLFVDITHPGNPDTTVSQHLIDKNWARSWSGHH